jgi:hypothetical protein
VAQQPVDLHSVAVTGMDLMTVVARLRDALVGRPDAAAEPSEHGDNVVRWVDQDGPLLDEVLTEANRLKRALGATGSLHPTDHRRHPDPGWWPLYAGRFEDAAHSAAVRRGLRALAGAAVDLSGFVVGPTGEPEWFDRGDRLLQAGLRQIWPALGPDQLAGLSGQIEAVAAAGWSPTPVGQPSAVDDRDLNAGRIVDRAAGYYTRGRSFLTEVQDEMAAALRRRAAVAGGGLAGAWRVMEEWLAAEPPFGDPVMITIRGLSDRLRLRGLAPTDGRTLFADLARAGVLEEIAGPPRAGAAAGSVGHAEYRLHVGAFRREIAARAAGAIRQGDHPANHPMIAQAGDEPVGVPDAPAPAGSVVPAVPPAAQAPNSIQSAPNRWVFRFGGETRRFPAHRGVTYLVELIRRKGSELHALRLVEIVGGASVGRAGADPVADARALREYVVRHAELTDEAEAARRDNDPARAAAAAGELAALNDQVRAAVDGRGGPRALRSQAEQARKAVCRAVERAIARITDEFEALGRHLDGAVERGTFLRYKPDPDVGWEV